MGARGVFHVSSATSCTKTSRADRQNKALRLPQAAEAAEFLVGTVGKGVSYIWCEWET